MTIGRWDHAERRPGAPVLDVVAGLVPGPSAARVAKVAVREAGSRGARVRFVQVLQPGSDAAELDAGGTMTFGAALKALREVPRVPVSFEVAVGDAGPELVQRSGGAGLLVVGEDDDAALSALVTYCLEHATCDVLTARPTQTKSVPS